VTQFFLPQRAAKAAGSLLHTKHGVHDRIKRKIVEELADLKIALLCVRPMKPCPMRATLQVLAMR
jgi:predicted metal-binding transcription factor (methanogenesis marker protein 9)